jgi:O-antigen ligase
MDAEAASGSRAFARVLREGLGGMLLAGFSISCLLLVASPQAVMLTLAVMIGHAAWDLRKVMSASGSAMIRALGWLAPLLAVALAVWGLSTALMDGASARPGPGAAASHLTRMETYLAAFLSQPLTGYGLGSIDAVGAANTTLFNADAMLADGGARNLALEWLVETGVAGFACLVIVLVAMHIQMAAGLRKKSIPRTFPRLAIATGALLLLHGVADSSLDLPSAVWFYALLTGAACGVASIGRSPPAASR